MYTCSMKLVGKKPIVFGRYVDPDELPAEKGMKECDVLNKHYRLKAHVDEDEHVVITPFAVRNCIVTAAHKAGEKFKGRTGWASVFKTGFSVPDNMLIKVGGKSIKAKDLDSWTQFIPYEGKGGTKRVPKTFPIIKSDWSLDVILIIEDDVISETKVEEYCILAGQRVGLGSFRKENNGIFGIFDVENFKVKK